MVRIPISRYHMLDSSHIAFLTAEEGKVRYLSPEARRAQEIIGHVIDHLADELVCEGNLFGNEDARANAIQILLSLSRLVHLECPEI